MPHASSACLGTDFLFCEGYNHVKSQSNRSAAEQAAQSANTSKKDAKRPDSDETFHFLVVRSSLREQKTAGLPESGDSPKAPFRVVTHPTRPNKSGSDGRNSIPHFPMFCKGM